MVKQRRNAPTAEQEAEQKAQREAVYQLPSTYGVVTAERLLAKLGVVISQASTTELIQQPQAYLHALLYAPAKRMMIDVDTERCRDIQAYGQQKLIHYLFSGEASKPEEEAGQSMRETIEQNRLHMVEMGKTLTEWREQNETHTKSVFDELTERAAAWLRTVEEVMACLLPMLQEQSLLLEGALYEDFKLNLQESSALVSIDEQTQQALTLPEKLGPIEKALVGAFAKHQQLETLTASLLQTMRPQFQELDKKLLSHFDDLTGFNQAQSERYLKDSKFINDMAEKFENHISKIVRALFEYYKEYASDAELKVDVDQAFEQGVDESVADDYRALHQ